MNRFVLLTFFITAFCSPAVASVSSVGTEAVDSVYELQDIDIVAIKQQANLSELPLGSTRINTETVDILDISDIKRVSDIAPNFYIPQYGSRITSSIYVRGIGARMDQPSIGLNIDNVPVLNKDAYDLEIPDIADIEILRGPQSSLFGRNTMAGLMNIRTLSPMIFQGWKLKLQGALPASFKFSAGWYKKSSSNMAYSLNAGIYHNSGEYRNEFNGEKTGREWSGNIRLRLEWQPLRNLSISNVISSSLLQQNGYPYESLKSQKIEYNDDCFYHRFLLSDGLSLKWTQSGFDLTSVTSVQYIDDNMTLDQDFLPLSFFTLTQRKKEIAVTEDLTLHSKSKGKYNWLAGFFAFYRHLDMKAPVTFKDNGISDLIESHRNEANPYRPIKWMSRSFPLNSDFIIPSVGVALYHESRLSLSRWNLSAGIRFDFEHISMDYHSFCSTGYYIFDNPSGKFPFNTATPDRFVPIDIDNKGSLSRNYFTVLPKITALYDLLYATDANLYVSLGRGYKAGGFNTQMFSDVLQQSLMEKMGMTSAYNVGEIVSYKPEECWSFEVGAHLPSINQIFHSELSVFYIDINNQQLTMFPDGTTTGRIMTNAGKTRSFGAEVSLRYSPTRYLSFNISYGYTNVKFKEFFNGIRSLKGKTLPYAPSNTFWAQALYTFRNKKLGNKVIIFDVNVKGNGKIYWNEENTLSQPFHALLGASVSLSHPEWEVQIFGRNITDTRYNTFYFKSMGNEFLQRGEGINLGLAFTLNIN